MRNFVASFIEIRPLYVKRYQVTQNWC